MLIAGYSFLTGNNYIDRRWVPLRWLYGFLSRWQ